MLSNNIIYLFIYYYYSTIIMEESITSILLLCKLATVRWRALRLMFERRYLHHHQSRTRSHFLGGRRRRLLAGAGVSERRDTACGLRSRARGAARAGSETGVGPRPRCRGGQRCAMPSSPPGSPGDANTTLAPCNHL